MPRNSGAFVVLCLLVATSAGATPYAGAFLATGIGARPLGLGGSFVALVDDASATYWNAAALPRNQSAQVMYMHTERFGDLVNTDSGALVFRSREKANGGRSAFGLALIMVSVPNIRFTPTDLTILADIIINDDGDGVYEPELGELIDFDQLNDNVKEVTDRQMGLYLSYGRSKILHSKLSLGGSLKFVRKSVEDFSALGIGLDLGALIELNQHWFVGLNLQDITTTFLEWSNTPTGEREYITPTVKLGTAYTLPIAALAGAVSLTVDFDFRFEDEVETTFTMGSATGDVRAGLEYVFREALALRVGSERLGGDSEPFTAGAGFRIKRVTFDYAYRNHSDLDDTHRVSGGFDF